MAEQQWYAVKARIGMTWKKEAVAFVEGRKDCRCEANWPTTTMRVKLADVIPWPEQATLTLPSGDTTSPPTPEEGKPMETSTTTPVLSEIPLDQVYDFFDVLSGEAIGLFDTVDDVIVALRDLGKYQALYAVWYENGKPLGRDADGWSTFYSYYGENFAPAAGE